MTPSATLRDPKPKPKQNKKEANPRRKNQPSVMKIRNSPKKPAAKVTYRRKAKKPEAQRAHRETFQISPMNGTGSPTTTGFSCTRPTKKKRNTCPPRVQIGKNTCSTTSQTHRYKPSTARDGAEPFPGT